MKDSENAKPPAQQGEEQGPVSSLKAMVLHEATELQQLLQRVVQDCLLVLRSSCLTASNAGLVSSLGCGKVGPALLKCSMRPVEIMSCCRRL